MKYYCTTENNWKKAAYCIKSTYDRPYERMKVKPMPPIQMRNYIVHTYDLPSRAPLYFYDSNDSYLGFVQLVHK